MGRWHVPAYAQQYVTLQHPHSQFPRRHKANPIPLTEFWTEFWDGDFEKHGKRRFAEYYAEIRSLVPAENLLEYKMGEGWKPLCDFLEVPVPEGRKFPRTNDTDGFVDRCRRRNRMQMLNVAFRAAVVGGSLAAVVLGATMTVRRVFGMRA